MAGVKTVYTPISRTMPDVNGTVNGGGIEGVGICAEGKNQKNAWEFIKFLLSVEVQEIRREEKETCLPSVLSEQEKLIQANIERAERMAQADFMCGVGEALDEEEIAYYRETIQGADYYECSSPEVYRRFCEAMEPYFQGEERYEVCVDQLKDSLREYLAGR